MILKRIWLVLSSSISFCIAGFAIGVWCWWLIYQAPSTNLSVLVTAYLGLYGVAPCAILFAILIKLPPPQRGKNQ